VAPVGAADKSDLARTSSLRRATGSCHAAAMERMLKAVLGLGLAAGLLSVGASRALAEVPAADPPPPASLENHDVEAWAAAYLHTEGWTLLTHDLEGAHLTTANVPLKMFRGVVETDIRTELFHAVEVSPGPARSGVARWSVDCNRNRLAVLSMTVYSHNNLQGELAKKPGTARVWQEPNESQAVTIDVICKVARSGRKPEPKPLQPTKPS
jgi:hypothetical protein